VSRLPKNQRGDTIVEVLIALTVVGTMLTGAYASARRSMFAVMASQERLEALKLAEGQLERVKHHINAGTAIGHNPFCIDDLSNAVLNSTSPQCNQGQGGRYKLSTSRSGTPPDLTYTVTASWDRIGGGSDTLTLSYKVNN